MKGAVFMLASFPPASPASLPSLLFDLEDGCEVFLRNVQLSSNYSAVQLTKSFSSKYKVLPMLK
jgi:hypothetical protein